MKISKIKNLKEIFGNKFFRSFSGMTMKYVDCEGEGDTSVLNLKTGPIPV